MSACRGLRWVLVRLSELPSQARPLATYSSDCILGWGNLIQVVAKMVRWAGLEPATVGLENRCSIQLSYHHRELITSVLQTYDPARNPSVVTHGYNWILH